MQEGTNNRPMVTIKPVRNIQASQDIKTNLTPNQPKTFKATKVSTVKKHNSTNQQLNPERHVTSHKQTSLAGKATQASPAKQHFTIDEPKLTRVQQYALAYQQARKEGHEAPHKRASLVIRAARAKQNKQVRQVKKVKHRKRVKQTNHPKHKKVRRYGVIYGLHSGNGKIRYIGQTVNPDKRLAQHKKDKKSNPKKVAWIEKIGAENLQMVILKDNVPIAQLSKAEQREMNKRRNLLNAVRACRKRGFIARLLGLV